MAIVWATYTRQKTSAKAAIRYIQHRPGRDGTRKARELFGWDGSLGRWQAYSMIDSAVRGSTFFRIVISPDPNAEDSRKDLHLRDVTMHTMQALQDRLQKPVVWVAAEHTDHVPHRHVHVVAVVRGRLQAQDLSLLRQAATEACQAQRQERDRMQQLRQEQHNREEGQGEEAHWERHIR